MSVGRGVTQGIVGFILDALAPEGGLDPLSYAMFVLFLIILMMNDISLEAKIALILLAFVVLVVSPLEAIPIIDGIDGAIVLGIAGAMSGGMFASFIYDHWNWIR